MSNLPPPLPPTPVNPLGYYQTTDSALDARLLVRRLGVVWILVGGLWSLSHAATLIERLFFTVTGPGESPYQMMLTAYSAVSAALAVPLVIGGVMSLGARPSGAARLLLVVFAVGTLSVGLLMRIALQAAIPGFQPRASNVFPLIASIASMSAVPGVLLILLNVPGVRSLYR